MMLVNWVQSSVFYHIYPLGLCGAPVSNDFSSSPVNRLEKLLSWLDHLTELGVSAVYLGPVFESSSHGYDTVDYFKVDRRLGSNDDLAKLSEAIHARGMHLILDAVFNHVGRDFWAFEDILKLGPASAYSDWFSNLRFGEQSPLGDPFSYESWAGHSSLVKLNLSNPEVRQHLFDVVSMWIRDFNIDGLRLDAADSISIDFLQALAAFTRSQRENFWLMGEVVHGDYRKWANPHTLDSVTNYECFKGLYSSFNDANFFEIAYSLNRQFGKEGLYQEITMYNFLDNHDVNRIASLLDNPAHLFPLNMLLFTMPGTPSIYYGSEWGIKGKKMAGDDRPMRPALNLKKVQANAPQPDLPAVIKRLSDIRRSSPALQVGNYRQLHVSSEQFAFQREYENERVTVALNASDVPAQINISHSNISAPLYDLLNGETLDIASTRAMIELPPNWGRILVMNIPKQDPSKANSNSL